MPLVRKAKPVPKARLEIQHIPVEDLIPDDDNPNEMDEATFDALIEEIRTTGFDEPVLVRPHPTKKGKYQIGSGHHRVKAAIIVGMQEVPTVVKNWTDREQKAALTKRNVLRGSMNKEKLIKLYRDMSKGKDPVTVQRELGFHDTKRFEAMINEVAKNLPPKQRKALAAAKEKIRSVDDLSSVLNRIFKESGSQLDKGYMVFSFGGKNHHYYQIDDATDKKLQQINAACEKAGIDYAEFLQSIVASAELPTKSPAKMRVMRKKKG